MARIKFLIALFACGGLLASCSQNTPQVTTFYTVNFETNGGSAIEPVKVQKGKKLKKPKDPTIEKASFEMWCNEERLVTPYNFAQPVMGNMTLYAKWSNRIFNVESRTLENLEVTGINGEPLDTIKATENYDLHLKVKASGSSNEGEYYIIPPSMDIFVGTSRLSANGYTIDVDEGSGLKTATLVIHGASITGDIEISGKAIDGSTSYAVAVSACYGLTTDSPYLVLGKAEPCTLTFSPTESYSLPDIENVLIRINNTGEWFNPTEETSNDGEATFIYKKIVGSNQVTITVNPNGQENISYIEIGLRAVGYNLLDELSWTQISNICDRKEAAKYFYIGETKRVMVNNCEHKVRIIGINHDELAEGNGTAEITFEFETLISNENGQYINYPHWNEWGNNEDFAASSLNNQLNNPVNGVISMLPVNLRNAIKRVNKTYVKNHNKSVYSTDLFVLSKTELSGSVTSEEVWIPDEGTPYPFYDFSPTDDWVEKRYKYDADGRNQPYWTRTPGKAASVWLTKQSSSPQANFILVDVNVASGYYTDIALSPAFCI